MRKFAIESHFLSSARLVRYSDGIDLFTVTRSLAAASTLSIVAIARYAYNGNERNTESACRSPQLKACSSAANVLYVELAAMHTYV